MRLSLLLILTLFCLLISCLDYQRSKHRQIVGRCYIVNPSLPEDMGNSLVYLFPSGIEKYPLSDSFSVDELISNDTIMLVKTSCIFQTIQKNKLRFYILNHRKGDTLISVKVIDSSEYRFFSTSLESKYRFSGSMSED